MRLLKWFTPLRGPLTRDNIIDWLLSTQYIEHYTRAHIHPLDKQVEDDYLQQIYLQILEIPEELLIQLFKDKGKFTNYLKRLVINNINSVRSDAYRINKKWHTRELYVDMEDLLKLESSGSVIVPTKINTLEQIKINRDGKML